MESHDSRNMRQQFNPYVNNEGTVVAVAGEDFVVVGGVDHCPKDTALLPEIKANWFN